MKLYPFLAIFPFLCLGCMKSESGGNEAPQQQLIEDKLPGREGLNASIPPVVSALIRNGGGDKIQGLTYHTDSGNPAGDDGVYLTSDDDLKGYDYQEMLQDGKLRRIRGYDGRGDDGLWLTRDDQIQGYEDQFYGPAGELYTLSFNQAGEDGLWFSEDDRPEQYEILSRSQDQTVHAIFGKPGPNGRWLDGDDVPLRWSLYTLHNENRSSTMYFSAPGSDGRWFTTDDFVSDLNVQERNELTGEIISSRYYPGPDGVPDPDTDLLYQQNRRLVEADGARVLVKHAQTWGDIYIDPETQQPAIKTVKESATLTLRTNGLIEQAWQFDSPGEDNVWFTGDDIVTRYATESAAIDTAHDYRIVTYREYHRAGADMIWGTDDDLLAEERSRLMATRTAPVLF